MHLAFVAAEPDREQMHMPRAAESNITPCAAEQRNRVVFLELANGAERGVRGIVTGVRSGCQQNDVACAASQLLHRGKTLRRRRDLVRFINNQQIPENRCGGAQHFRLFHEIGGGDGDGFHDPWVHAKRQRRCHCAQRIGVQNRRANAKPAPQLVAPLLAQTSGRENERALAPAALLQLGQRKARLNRLAEAYSVGQQ